MKTLKEKADKLAMRYIKEFEKRYQLYFAGAYQQAVTYVYGRGSVAAADGIPGKAFCVMLGMDPHPAL